MAVKRKCRVCAQSFTPGRSIQPTCDRFECKLAHANKTAEKLQRKRTTEAKKAKAEDSRKTRAQLEAMKTVPMLKKEAQREFNRYIRLRDARLPCISCDAPPPDMGGLHAGRDCGHWRSTGSADHLRYVEDNAAGQCVRCNQWGAGMAVEYRIGLIKRIGLERVEALESNNQRVKWTRDGLREIRNKYRALARAMS